MLVELRRYATTQRVLADPKRRPKTYRPERRKLKKPSSVHPYAEYHTPAARPKSPSLPTSELGPLRDIFVMMGDWLTYAGHRTLVTDDLVVVEPHGHMSPPHISKLLNEILARVVAAHGLAYVLLDARDGTPADAESRRIISDWVRAHPGKTIFAVFGASRTASAVAMLLLNAIRLVSGRRLQLRMFDGEAEARSWLLAQRERRKNGQPVDV